MSSRHSLARASGRVKRPIAVDLYSGAGGMSLGFEQAGFDIVFSVDRDGYHSATHKRNFPKSVAFCGSVADLTGQKIRELAGIDGHVDLIFGGPPCQGFSHMGMRDPGDHRNSLIDEFARIVDELRPKAFVMENVVGLQTGNTKAIFERFVEKLTSLDYVITTPVRTLNAMNYGVPQSRERLFVLGLRKDLKGTLLYPEGRCSGQPPRPTVWQAIEDLPAVENFDALMRVDGIQYDKQPNALNLYARIARGLKRDGSDFSHPRKWQKGTCSGCFQVRHTLAVKNLYAATRPGHMVPGHKLPRLDPNGISPTLRAGSESEHGSHTAPRPVHPFAARCITIREAARLHGFPDWFRFYPSKWHAYRQIGNSVCPPVARAIGRCVLTVLGISIHNLSLSEIEVSETFTLPENRLRHEARVPQMGEFPKVIEELFRQARNSVTGELKESTIPDSPERSLGSLIE